ncbi:MAG: carboxymuconolactone decarboxylase family protein [Pseudomonadales bacterium]
MPRLEPLPRDALREFEPALKGVERAMGFVPNSLLTLARKPDILRAALGLFQAIQQPGSIPPPLKSMIANVASQAAGCRYCQAHTGHTAAHVGVAEDKLTALWNFEDSPLFDAAEKAALRVARDAAQVPNAVSDEEFAALREHFAPDAVVEIVAVISMFGFLNRWNDTIATELESSPLAFARERLTEYGWSAGKHAP